MSPEERNAEIASSEAFAKHELEGYYFARATEHHNATEAKPEKVKANKKFVVEKLKKCQSDLQVLEARRESETRALE